MKRSYKLPFLLVFCFCLVLGLAAGLWTGRAMGAAPESSLPQDAEPLSEIEQGPEQAPEAEVPASTSDQPAPTGKGETLSHRVDLKTAPNGQRNLLLLVADDLQSKHPRLQSAWLLLYLPPAPRLTLVPLFPAVLQQPEADARMSETFGLTPAGKLAPVFMTTLGEYDLWWSQYIVLDQTSLALLIDMNGGLDFGGGPVSGRQALALSQGKTGLDQLKSQAELVYAMCYNQSPVEKMRLNPEELITDLGPRVKTDLSLNELARDWQNIVGSDDRQCRFPTLKFQFGAPLP